MSELTTKTKIAALSDIHGNLPLVEPCDLLLIAGDISPLRIQNRYELMIDWMNEEFYPWVKSLPCKHVVMVAGNHDFYFRHEGIEGIQEDIINNDLGDKFVYLENSMFECNCVKIYGTPNCVGPLGWPFCDTKETYEKYELIEPCNILLTHQPPRFGKVGCSYPYQYGERDFGSDHLLNKVFEHKIDYVVCGHIHTGIHDGVRCPLGDKTSILYNVSLLNENYELVYPVTYFEI